MSMGLTLQSAEGAVIGANEFSSTYRIVKHLSGSMLFCFALFFSIFTVVIRSVGLTPFLAGLLAPFALFFAIGFHVALVLFVDFFLIGFAVLAITLFVFFDVFKSVFSLILRAGFLVFKGHGMEYTINVPLGGF